VRGALSGVCQGFVRQRKRPLIMVRPTTNTGNELYRGAKRAKPPARLCSQTIPSTSSHFLSFSSFHPHPVVVAAPPLPTTTSSLVDRAFAHSIHSVPRRPPLSLHGPGWLRSFSQHTQASTLTQSPISAHIEPVASHILPPLCKISSQWPSSRSPSVQRCCPLSSPSLSMRIWVTARIKREAFPAASRPVSLTPPVQLPIRQTMGRSGDLQAPEVRARSPFNRPSTSSLCRSRTPNMLLLLLLE